MNTETPSRSVPPTAARNNQAWTGRKAASSTVRVMPPTEAAAAAVIAPARH